MSASNREKINGNSHTESTSSTSGNYQLPKGAPLYITPDETKNLIHALEVKETAEGLTEEERSLLKRQKNKLSKQSTRLDRKVLDIKDKEITSLQNQLIEKEQFLEQVKKLAWQISYQNAYVRIMASAYNITIPFSIPVQAATKLVSTENQKLTPSALSTSPYMKDIYLQKKDEEIRQLRNKLTQLDCQIQNLQIGMEVLNKEMIDLSKEIRFKQDQLNATTINNYSSPKIVTEISVTQSGQSFFQIQQNHPINQFFPKTTDSIPVEEKKEFNVDEFLNVDYFNKNKFPK